MAVREAADEISEELKKEAAVTNSYAEVIIADSVDTAFFVLLDAIDNGVLKLRFVSSSGEEVEQRHRIPRIADAARKQRVGRET